MVIILQSKIDAFINHRSEVSPKSFFFDYNKPKTKLIQKILPNLTIAPKK